jgi:hypothetical protein
MGNGSVTSHRQIAAVHPRTAAADTSTIINADTDRTPYDTGTFASTGTVVAGKGVALPATALLENILEYARATPDTRPRCGNSRRLRRLGDRRIALAELHAAGMKDGHRFEAKRKAYLSPRTTAFNVQGIKLAVHTVTGEIRILRSVHAADIGRLINPMQCRGQVDGAIAMGVGWALTEHMVLRRQRQDAQSPRCATTTSRLMRDAPRSEVSSPTLTTPSAPGRQGAGRMRHQPGGTGHRQCLEERHRRPLRAAAVHAGPHLRQAGMSAAMDPSGTVTIVTQTRAATGKDAEFAAWQEAMRGPIAGQTGFLDQRSSRPARPARSTGPSCSASPAWSRQAVCCIRRPGST